MRSTTPILMTAGCIIALLFVAEVLLPVLGIPNYLVPRPLEIALSLIRNFKTVAVSLGITLGEAGCGLMLGAIVSLPLAVATLLLPRAVLSTVTGLGAVFQSVPLIAVAPLLTLWFGHGYLSKAAAAMIMCLFPLLNGWLSGFASISSEQLQFFENLKATKFQTAKYLYFPLSLPFFFGGLRVAIPLALIGAIVGEFIGSAEGLGFQILQSSYYMKTADMFSFILVTASAGWAFTLIASALERKVLFWRATP